jgi:hypothetical protein
LFGINVCLYHIVFLSLVSNVILIERLCCYLGLWKECLNSDGQQFHQYQQNEQSLLTLTEHKQWLWHMMLEIQDQSCLYSEWKVT